MPIFDISHPKVLVVEWNAFTNLAVVQQLKVFGYECDAAYQPSQAFDLLNKRHAILINKELKVKVKPYQLILIDSTSAPSLADDICEMI